MTTHKVELDVDCSRNEYNAQLFLQDQSALSRYSSLPWELRHRIHTFCVQGSYDNEVVVRRGFGSRPSLLVRQSTGSHSYRWTKDSISEQVAPNRIGVTAAQELLETYYRTRTFKFIHDDLGALRPFLEADTFGLAMRPAEHVRRLHLQIQPFQYARLRETNAKIQKEQTCHQALESLLNLHSPRTAIEIHADLAQGFCDNEEYDELLGDAAGFIFRITSLIDRLKKMGLNIEVSFEGRWDGREGTRVCSGSLPSLDECITSMKIACQ